MAQLEAGRKLHVLALKRAAREREHHILLQKCGVESELRVWCQNTGVKAALFADGELDVFIDDQQSVWLVGVDVNPLQIEFAEPWEEFWTRLASTIVLVVSQDNWPCGSLERRRKLYWLHKRLSESQERLATCFVKKRIDSL